MIKVLHYLNQFFAGIGGEEKAGQEALFLPPHRLVLYLHDSSNSRSYKAFAPLPHFVAGPDRERPD